MKILIAEDDALSALVLRRALERLGHECIMAADGTAAWDLFQASDVDVVISDWMMPGLDGLELCQRIRDHQGERYTYFIFLSALGDSQHFLTAMRAGADDYLTKPLNRDELQARLIAAARVTSLHRRLAEQNATLGRLVGEQDTLMARLEATAESRGRLAGVTLAARELAHLLNNDLALAVGIVELLQVRLELPPELSEALDDAAAGLAQAEQHVKQFQAIARVETKNTPVGPSLDLDRSASSQESGVSSQEEGLGVPAPTGSWLAAPRA